MTFSYTLRNVSTLTRCSECRCQLPLNERGYCQRCEEGWYAFIDIPNASRELIERELGLARYYQGTLDIRGKVDRQLDTYIAELVVALRNF